MRLEDRLAEIRTADPRDLTAPSAGALKPYLPALEELLRAAREFEGDLCIEERGHCANHGGRLPCRIGDLRAALVLCDSIP